jgi:hypothetical protein
MFDGGPGAEPKQKVVAWFITDERAELIHEIRKLARLHGLEPSVSGYSSNRLCIKPHRVVHTSHDTYGYSICCNAKKIVWAPEFLRFPAWARDADLMFADAAGWNSPIHFRGGVGGHASVKQVAREARKYKIKRLIFAHIGRPTIRAIDAGELPPFGEFGMDGAVYEVITNAEAEC